MKLAQSESAVTGDPLPVTRAVKVGGGGSLLKLTVAKTGTGLGAVTSSPAGIELRRRLRSGIRSGQEKSTLTATAAAGSKFTGWSGWLLGHRHLQSDDERSERSQSELRPDCQAQTHRLKSGKRHGHRDELSQRHRLPQRLHAGIRRRQGGDPDRAPRPKTASKFTGWTVGRRQLSGHGNLQSDDERGEGSQSELGFDCRTQIQTQSQKDRHGHRHGDQLAVRHRLRHRLRRGIRGRQRSHPQPETLFGLQLSKAGRAARANPKASAK